MFGQISDWNGKARKHVSGVILKRYIFSQPFRKDIQMLPYFNLEDLNKINYYKSFWFFIVLGNNEEKSKDIMEIISNMNSMKKEMPFTQFTGSILKKVNIVLNNDPE